MQIQTDYQTDYNPFVLNTVSSFVLVGFIQAIVLAGIQTIYKIQRIINKTGKPNNL